MKTAGWAAAVLQVAAVTAAEVKPVSLDDCLRMGLAKNLDIRLAQYTPLLTKLSLSSALWTYEPTMNMGANQAFRATEGFAGIGQFNAPPNESWTEQFTAGFGGAVPTGLTYNIASGVNRQSGVFNGRDQGFTYTPFAAINLTQPILRNFWIDQPRLTIQLEKRNLKQGELDVRNQVIGTLTDVTLAYHDLIAARETDLTRNLTEKLLAYSLCRQLDGYDHIIVDQMLKNIASDGHKIQTLISEIVTSYPFLNRRVVE